jgi:antitoxin VapB
MVEWWIVRVERVIMSLNIKDRETHELVKKLADLRGTSLTSAVKDAVRDALAHETAQRDDANSKKKRRSEILKEFAQEYAARVKDPIHSWEINDLLYDENGLPK